MSRREFIKTAGAVTAGLALGDAALGAADAAQPADGPNILWICTDQQRFDTIAALGNKFIRTPNLITRKPATPQTVSTAGTNHAHHGNPSKTSATVIAAKTSAGNRCP